MFEKVKIKKSTFHFIKRRPDTMKTKPLGPHSKISHSISISPHTCPLELHRWVWITSQQRRPGVARRSLRSFLLLGSWRCDLCIRYSADVRPRVYLKDKFKRTFVSNECPFELRACLKELALLIPGLCLPSCFLSLGKLCLIRSRDRKRRPALY